MTAPVPRESLAAIARAETAAIYTQTVPEHGGGHKRPQPHYVTEWELRRLIEAARKLRGGA